MRKSTTPNGAPEIRRKQLGSDCQGAAHRFAAEGSAGDEWHRDSRAQPAGAARLRRPIRVHLPSLAAAIERRRRLSAAAEEHPSRRKKGAGGGYKSSLGIGHFWIFRARTRQSWPPRPAAGAARDEKNGGSCQNTGEAKLTCVLTGEAANSSCTYSNRKTMKASAGSISIGNGKLTLFIGKIPVMVEMSGGKGTPGLRSEKDEVIIGSYEVPAGPDPKRQSGSWTNPNPSMKALG
jgi:hypothetical protein